MKEKLTKCNDIIAELKMLASEKKLASMKRVKIKLDNALGVSINDIRKLAKEVEISLELAIELWGTGIHEARLLAGYVCPSEDLTQEIAEKWVADFDSWDLCDQVMDVICEADFGWQKSVEWCDRPQEFVRRTGFAMFCYFAVHDKKADDEKFLSVCFPLIEKHCEDERNFVKKAVNWALRNIGKRNLNLNKEAVKLAESLLERNNKTASWIARDAIRELTSEKILARLKKKKLK